MKIIRGDTGRYKFARKRKDKSIILDEAKQVYFTVKRNYNQSNILFQKVLDDMTFDEEGYYHFVIEPEETDNMSYGDYVYDIEVITDEYKKTISKGKFTIDKEVTFARNEV